MNEKDILHALGSLAAAYQDETVKEILVDGPGEVYIRREGEMEELDAAFDSADAILMMVQDVMAAAQTPLQEGAVTAEARLPDNSRFTAVLPPVAVSGPYVVIRKPFVGQMTWEQLLSYGSVDEQVIEIIQSALDAQVTILVSGGTGSGKTTLLNMIAGRIEPEKRLVAVEDVHELRINLPHVVCLEANAAGADMSQLIVTGSRMMPYYLIVNELRGGEVFQALTMWNSGHSGMGTLHAADIQDALNRLERMCLMADQVIRLDDIRSLIASGVQLMMQINHLHSGKRRIVEMAEMRGLENGRYVLQPLINYNAEEDTFESTGIPPSWAG